MKKKNTGFIVFVITIILFTVTEFLLFIKPGFLTEKRREKLLKAETTENVASGNGKREKSSIEKSTEKNTDDEEITASTEKTKKTTAEKTEDSTEKTTEKKTKKTTAEKTEDSTEKTTEKKTKKTTAEKTEESTEKTTEKKTEKKTTEKNTEEATESPFDTTERPDVEDFYWFINDYMNGEYVRDAKEIDKYSDLNGNWKVMIYTNPFNEKGEYTMQFLNCRITASTKKIKLVMDFYRVFSGTDSKYYDETDRKKEIYTADWDKWFAEVETGYSKFQLYAFFTKDDKQYIVGNVEWNSGEYGYIVFVRP
ncbi:hypothetical protein SAMN04487934_10374 [Eubacterium ruminantium]|nr:hypothetical protein SAMN04487934_10374 [Eubacterium ruminantium]